VGERSFDYNQSKTTKGKGLLEISRRKIMNMIVNRIVFIYSAWDILKEISHCVCCRKLKSKKDISNFRQ